MFVYSHRFTHLWLLQCNTKCDGFVRACQPNGPYRRHSNVWTLFFYDEIISLGHRPEIVLFFSGLRQIDANAVCVFLMDFCYGLLKKCFISQNSICLRMYMAYVDLNRCLVSYVIYMKSLVSEMRDLFLKNLFYHVIMFLC